MNEPFYPREMVASQLAVSSATLLRYESRGLVNARSAGPGQTEGYGPVEVRRLWTIITFQRDLGINIAGVEVIFRLRDQIDATRTHFDRLARHLQAFSDQETDGLEVDGEFV